MADDKKLFNARLESSAVRAIELHENDEIDLAGIRDLVVKAVEQNGANNQ